MRRRVIGGVLGVMLAVFMAGEALAAGVFYGYNLTMPKFGGSNTTNNQTRVANDNAVLCSGPVGANYTLYARLEEFDNSVWGGPYQPFMSNQRREWTPEEPEVGVQFHIRLATGYTTTVNVQAQGKWSPDNPGNC